MAGKRKNPWVVFLKQWRSRNKGVSLKDSMKRASVEWKKKRQKSETQCEDGRENGREDRREDGWRDQSEKGNIQTPIREGKRRI